MTAIAQALSDSKTVTIRASDAQLLSERALDTDCTVTSGTSDSTDSALQAVRQPVLHAWDTCVYVSNVPPGVFVC